MLVRDIIDEDFVNYYKPSMTISTVFCDLKCVKENCCKPGHCQNVALLSDDTIRNMPVSDIFSRYISNPITHAIVIAGLEPAFQFTEIDSLISYFRRHGCMDDFVIYTGYCESEIKPITQLWAKNVNVIVKFGRYCENRPEYFNDVLGVVLASDNQYALKLS